MENYTEKLKQKAQEILQGDEPLLIGVRAMADGVQAAQMSGAMSGAMSTVSGTFSFGASSAGDKMSEAQNRAEKVEFPHAPFIAIGLTDRRILVWERGKLFQGLKEILGDFPLDRIVKVRGTDNKGLGWRVTIHLKGEKKPIKIDVHKRDNPKDFVGRLRAISEEQRSAE